ncbi:hypothetical protein BCR33DRAFT_61740 [Rhizoclosmatium globosum]|uniref:Cyclin-like domain-containing protein n=1 Tax=Rhizoclosmatium globosum TaxID=329046 RepID=A0A1Y2CMJ6_9FUNG|nr:hypothetical protein BCR33DRAFT_61740 [Rhizoclosmatium globosum]|eukprot:ORY48233.1 hypothetical protein BCR33DRAFT_61740 [Rhizoclosmatium globosum]
MIPTLKFINNLQGLEALLYPGLCLEDSILEDIERIRNQTPLGQSPMFGATEPSSSTQLSRNVSFIKPERLPLSSFERPSMPSPDIGEGLTALAAQAKFKRILSTKKSERLRSVIPKTPKSRNKSIVGGGIFTHHEAEFRPQPRAELHKFNSCSTLFIDSTLANADLKKTLKCVATALAVNIRRNNELNILRTDDIFSEKLRPLSKHIQFHQRILSEEDIYKFLDCIFQAAELNVECAVITLVYIERMLINTGITLHSCNWARIVLGGLLLASKVWDDHAVWNVDFCQIFPDIEVKDLNELERWYMSAIQFNVSVKASVYARYYFELRDLLDTEMRIWTSKPLIAPDISQNTAIPAINVDAGSNAALNENNTSSASANAPADKGVVRRSRSDYGFVRRGSENVVKAF